MTQDSRGQVERLLRHAVSSGLAPSAVAVWGIDATRPRSAAVGHSLLRPRAVVAGRDTWFDLASLTKPLVVTTLCLIAIRRGELATATPVGEVLPEARSCALGRATIRQLLSHSSGLPAWRPLYAIAARPDEVVDAILQIPLEAEPGAVVVYSCLDFILLGVILERVFGEPLARAFDRLVLQPLRLQDELGFRPDPAQRRVAGGAASATVEREMTIEHGYGPDRVPPSVSCAPDDGNARFLGGVAGNAGLFGTGQGVYALAAEYLPGGGRLLGSDDVSVATAVATRASGQIRGLGWQLASTPGCSAGPALSRAAVGHTGFTGTSVWVDPERRLTLVLLTNRHHPAPRAIDLHPLRRRFHALAVQDLAAQPSATAASVGMPT
jgi:CubicO group peptidase (beta-lactamase class C family)